MADDRSFIVVEHVDFDRPAGKLRRRLRGVGAKRPAVDANFTTQLVEIDHAETGRFVLEKIHHVALARLRRAIFYRQNGQRPSRGGCKMSSPAITS